MLTRLLSSNTSTLKRELEQHKKTLGEFVAEKLVDAGQPCGAIVDCAEKEGVDLIVMSSHGRSGLSPMLVGSVTGRLVRTAPCPVLVVPTEAQ